jgi:hypothetical protein
MPLTKSTTHLSLSHNYISLKALMHTGAVTVPQILPNGRLIFSRSSLRGPNDVFIIHGL